jgi:predicted transcriptional regulator
MQNNGSDDYRIYLNQLYQKRRQKNKNYSTRAFARDLGVGVATLHDVLVQKRHLSKRNLDKIARLLKWNEAFVEKAQLSIRYGQTNSLEKRQNLSKKDFGEISNWYDFAIAALCKLPENSLKPEWFAARLNISTKQASGSLSKLQQLGLISAEKKSFTRTTNFHYIAGLDNKIIKKQHLQFLSKAKKAVSNESIDTYKYSLTIPVAPEVISKVGELSDGFLARLLKLSQTGRPEHVYAMVMTFFPLSTSGISE